METTSWLAIAGGGLAIAWINWWFLLSRPTAARAATEGGIQVVPIVVAGGYEPADIRLRSGVPTRLLFDRRETTPCSEEIVLPDFGLERALPAHRTTAVEFVPERPGTYEFTCGMRMLRGRITVEAPEGTR
jgi:plastocyanin domain-containing protein